MLAERIEGKWIDTFARTFELCGVKKGELAAIFSETLSRSVNVHLAELALLRLGARPFHVVAPTPPQTAGVPIRSTGCSVAIGGHQAIVAALSASSFIVDCTVEGMIDARDVGLAAAAALRDRTLVQGHRVVTGADRPTYAEFAALVQAAIGRPVRYESVSPNEAKRRFLAAGMPGWKADALVHMYAYLQDPATTPLTVGFTALTGRPPRRLGDFVIEHARGFAKGTLRH